MGIGLTNRMPRRVQSHRLPATYKCCRSIERGLPTLRFPVHARPLPRIHTSETFASFRCKRSLDHHITRPIGPWRTHIPIFKQNITKKHRSGSSISFVRKPKCAKTKKSKTRCDIFALKTQGDHGRTIISFSVFHLQYIVPMILSEVRSKARWRDLY